MRWVSERGYRRGAAALAIAATVVGAPTVGQGQGLDSLTIAAFNWRPIGPAIFEGRVTDIVGIPSPSQTFFVAAAGGGIWKTTNNGLSYRPVFENQRVSSMGALAIAPSDTMQVWAGTGEANTRNSVEPGYGVYKSTDGGLTWKSMGLEKTEHIGKIAVHPTNPDVVFVAALGAAWRSNPERGLYLTKDGGKTWTLSKFISDKAGFIDVAFDPRNPNVVYAASYERVRGPWFYRSGGPGSALWKSIDGGTTWNEIRGGGFPETMKGRINLALAPTNPDMIYVSVEADSLPNPSPKPGAEAQKLKTGIYRSKDAGATWEQMNELYNRPFYFNQIKVDTKNPERIYFSSFYFSDDGGKHARYGANGVHVDHHAMWIDPNDPKRLVVGSDGGVSVSLDRGGNYLFGKVLPISQFYEVSFDYSFPYNVCGGAQDNGSWCAPSRWGQYGGITNSHWLGYGGGDGFYAAQDPSDSRYVYGESQGGGIYRYNRQTGRTTSLGSPSWNSRWLQIEDSIAVLLGDSLRPWTRDLEAQVEALRQQGARDSAGLDLRFNWNTPFILSPHDPKVYYVAGNRVLKSTQRGEHLMPISPDISKQDKERVHISINTTGGITNDATGAETYGTGTTLAESPVKRGLLFVGTDDGNLWMTRTDGASWEQIPESRFPGLPNEFVYISRIEPSHFDSSTFYVAFDNHRVGDFTPYVYRTTDGGKTFKSIVANLPTGGPDMVRVIREDPHNPDLLFVGTSCGLYVSVDRGTSWQKFMTGMPTVPIYDIQIHPRDREIITATHGRGFWIADIAALEDWSPEVASKPEHLFQPKTAYQMGGSATIGEPIYGNGHQTFDTPSPPSGAGISYRLTSATKDTVTLVVTNAIGDTLFSQVGPNTAGVHTVYWGMQDRPPAKPLSRAQRRDSSIIVRRVTAVFDSLVRAGRLTRSGADKYVEAIYSGRYDVLYTSRGFEYAGSRGGPSPEDPARPGEGGWANEPPPDTTAKDTTAKAPAKTDSAATADSAAAKKGLIKLDNEYVPRFDSLFTGGVEGFEKAIRIDNRPFTVSAIGLKRPRYGYSQAYVPPGDYGVILKVGNRQYRRLLRVERVVQYDDPTDSFMEFQDDLERGVKERERDR